MPPWLTSDAFWMAATAVSVAMFAGTIVAIPIAVVRMPADYFVAPIPKRPPWVIVVRTAAAAILIALGLAMLVLPGQGLLTILVGVSLLDFAAKRRVERRILASRGVLHVLNHLRASRGKPPLVEP